MDLFQPQRYRESILIESRATSTAERERPYTISGPSTFNCLHVRRMDVEPLTQASDLRIPHPEALGNR